MKLLSLLFWSLTNPIRREQLHLFLGIWRGAAYLGRENRLFVELLTYMGREIRYVEDTIGSD